MDPHFWLVHQHSWRCFSKGAGETINRSEFRLNILAHYSKIFTDSTVRGREAQIWADQVMTGIHLPAHVSQDVPFSKLSLIITLITVSGTATAVNGLLISLCHELWLSDLIWAAWLWAAEELSSHIPCEAVSNSSCPQWGPSLLSGLPLSQQRAAPLWRWVLCVRAGPDLSQNKPQREGVRIFNKETGSCMWRMNLSLRVALHWLTGIIIFGLKWGTKVSPEAIRPCWLFSLSFPGEIFLWNLEQCRQNVAEACSSQSVGYSTLCGISTGAVPPMLKLYLSTALKQTKKSIIKIEKRLSVSLNLREVSPFMVAEICSHTTLSKPSGYFPAAPFSWSSSGPAWGLPSPPSCSPFL